MVSGVDSSGRKLPTSDSLSMKAALLTTMSAMAGHTPPGPTSASPAVEAAQISVVARR